MQIFSTKEEKNKNLSNQIADSLRHWQFCLIVYFEKGLITDKGEKGNLFFPTCEAIKVAAHPPIIRDAAMPAKCPTTVPTNTKIEF